MPFPNAATFVKDRKKDNDGTNVDDSVLELGDASEQDELSEDEPVRVRKKHRWKRGWKTIKPKQSTAQKESEKAQREEQDISFIIELFELVLKNYYGQIYEG